MSIILIDEASQTLQPPDLQDDESALEGSNHFCCPCGELIITIKHDERKEIATKYR